MQSTRDLPRALRARPALLRASTALGSLVAITAMTSPAHAADECGTPDNGAVTCTAAGNPYAGGITYTPTGDLHVTLNDGVDATNSVNVTGTGMTHVTNDGTIETTGDGTTFTPGASGIIARGGSVMVDGNGMITTSGMNARGIDAVTLGTTGDVTVDVGDVTTTGTGGGGPGFFPNSSAIFANTNGGNIDVTAGDLSTAGTFAAGVQAISNTGDIAVDTGAITTTGDNADGVLAQTGGTGSVSITTNGPIETSGQTANGIEAYTAGGPVMVDAGDITTHGFNAAGVTVNSGDTAMVSAGNVMTEGGFATGVDVTAVNDATVHVGDVTTGSYDSFGVAAASTDGDATIDSTGTITTTGATSIGAYAVSTNGDAHVTVNNVSTTGDNSNGVIAVGQNAMVTVNGAVSTEGMMNANTVYADGVTASGTNGIAHVINNGSISTMGDNAYGIRADGTQGVTIEGDGTVSTMGDGATGISALAASGPVDVTTGDVSTAGMNAYGIDAQATDGPAMVNAASVTTMGDGSTGVHVMSATDDVTVTTGDVMTSGVSAPGVDASSMGGGVSVTTGMVTTAGATSPGIMATATGPVMVDAGGVSTMGDASTGIAAMSTTDAVDVTSGDISTEGMDAMGIDAQALAGPAMVNAASVTTMGDGSTGVHVTSATDDVTVTTGDVMTSGASAPGVDASSMGGDVSVTTGMVSTSGDMSPGILAASSTGGVMVHSAGVTTTGAGSVGISAQGDGPVMVTTGPAHSASDAAVIATSLSGPATVTLNGATTGGAGTAVAISAGTDATLNVGANGSLTAAGGGATLDAGGMATVNNAGSIIGNGPMPILTVLGTAPLTFNNAGEFAGRVAFAAGASDTVNNTGIYHANYNQDFGGGTDVFNNMGTLTVRAGSSTPATIAFTGLETFNNSGLVDLRNGVAGDVLDLSSNFAASGDSRLGIDLNDPGTATAATSDRLVAAGPITGSTALFINEVGAGPSLNPGTIFAVGGTGSSADAFHVAPAFQDAGFIHYSVAYDPATGAYSLYGTPGDSVYRTLKVAEGAQQLWYKSADAWSAHMADLRDGNTEGLGNGGSRLWGQFYGGVNKRHGSEQYTTYGQTRDVDLAYTQDAFGGQLGYDVGSNGNFAFGVTGGYLNSTLDFTGVAAQTKFDVANVGIYAGLHMGGLFANVLAKYDWMWVDSRDDFAGYRDKFHGHAWGAQGEVGYRFGSDAFYVEPAVSLAYVRTSLNDLTAFNQTIGFDRFDGLRGKAGARVGKTFDVGASRGVLYAEGNYVHEFKGDDGIVFESAGYTLPFRNRPLGDYGEAKLGFNITMPSGVTGFMEGFGDFSNNYKGGGARAGLRFNF